MKKIIVLLLSFFFLWISIPVFAANSTIDTLLQPQLKVVGYNQNLESLKANLLNSVSIFSDKWLYTQWASMITSIGILIFIVILFKVWVSIVNWSKDNMIKFIAFTVLLFLVGWIYAPLFSGISGFMAWSERIYTDPVSKLQYSRVYLPANVGITVEPYYMKRTIESDTNLFPQRGDNSKYSWEYLWIPAKVAQTQWQSDTDPTIRYSKAFYGVNIDTLFKGTSLNLFVWNFANTLWILKWWKCEVTIDPKDFSTRVDKVPMSFLESIWRVSYQTEALSNWVNEALHLPNFTNNLFVPGWEGPQVKVNWDCSTFPFWVYLMSNEYLSSYWKWKNEKDNWEIHVWSTKDLREVMMWSLWYLYSSLNDILNSSWSYTEQKKLLYIFQAYSTLYQLTQKAPSEDIKSGSEKIKQSILSCSHLVMWNVQDSSDYKTCLIVDQAWDTTMYTQDTSKELWILWKTPNQRKGFVFPVPIWIDWTKDNITNSYWDPTTFADLSIPKTVEKISEWTFSVFFSWIWNSLAEMVKPAVLAWRNSIQTDMTAEKISSTLIEAWIDLALTDKQKLSVYNYLLQKKSISDWWMWYNGVFNPFLASIESYDLNGDWIPDYSETSENYKKTTSYYGYHYWSSVPMLTKDQVNFTQQPFYNEVNIPGVSDWTYCNFKKDIDWSSVFKKCEDLRPTDKINFNWYSFWSSNLFFVPFRNTSLYLSPGNWLSADTVVQSNNVLIQSNGWNSTTTWVWTTVLPTSVNQLWTPTTNLVLPPLGLLERTSKIIASIFSSITSVSIASATDSIPLTDRKTISITGWDLYIWVGDTYYDITPMNKDWVAFSVTLKDKTTLPYKYFPDTSNLKNIYGYSNWTKISIWSQYKFKEIGFTLLIWNTKQIFILWADWQYTIYTWSLSGSKQTEVEFIKANNWKGVANYKAEHTQAVEPNIVYQIDSNVVWLKTYKYVEEIKQGVVEWKRNHSNEISNLALMSNDNLTDLWSYIYSLFDLQLNDTITFNLQLERTINKIYSTNSVSSTWQINQLDINRINSLLWTALVKESGTVARDQFTEKWETFSWDKKITPLKWLDYSSYKDVFSKDNDSISISPRVLLNAQLNIPLTYTPSNEAYLADYWVANKVCLISKSDTTENKTLFDIYPGQEKKPNALDKCSTIWDHMRLTDIRLQTFKQSGSLLTVWANKDIFTHFSVPLLTSKFIPNFSSDRRTQSYAGETTTSDSLFSPTQVSWVIVKEWDVAVLKPGVIVWAYSHPFTMLVPTAVLPFIKYIKLDNPSEETLGSHVYTWGIYDWLTSVTKFLMDWQASKSVFWGSVVSQSEEQKYWDFVKEKYDSRPDALKFIEGSVPDRYFHAYYWSWYVSDSKAWTLSWVWGELGDLVLSFSNWFLSYRVEILKWIYIFSPVLAFTLLFTGTRKIFSFTLALTVWLLILPVVVLFFVNIFTNLA